MRITMRITMMSKCKKCGAEIKWIKTIAGKSMPCNPSPVTYWQREKAQGKVVTPNGEVISCEFEGDASQATGIGYIPHFATCPNAADFKRT